MASCAEFATVRGRKWHIYAMLEKENNPTAKTKKEVRGMKEFTTL